MSKNYNNSKKPYVGIDPAPKEDNTVCGESDTPIVNDFIGIVSDCKRLNVREQPDLDSNVLRIIDENIEVVVTTAFENDEWYCVTIDDVSGYCMKKFIAIKES